MATSNYEGMAGIRTQTDNCQLCSQPLVLNLSLVTHSLQSVKHLWSYLYHQNVRDTLVPSSTNTSSDEDQEIGAVPKFTFMLSAGGQGDINERNRDLKICGNCVLELEKLEKLHRDREALDKRIGEQVKTLEQLFRPLINGSDHLLDSIMRAPQLDFTFAGNTVGKENISRTLKFLNSVCEGIPSADSSTSTETRPPPPSPSSSSMSMSSQEQSNSQDQNPPCRDDCTTPESMKGFSDSMTEDEKFEEDQLDPGQLEVEASHQDSLSDDTGNLSVESFKQHPSPNQNEDSDKNAKDSESQMISTSPLSSHSGVSTTPQLAMVISSGPDFCRLKIEPLECSERQESTQSQEPRLLKVLIKQASRAVHDLRGLSTETESSTKNGTRRVPYRRPKSSTRTSSSNQYNNRCPVCKALVTSQPLQIHMRIHTGEKPYKCSICNRAFSQNGNMRRHQRGHKNLSPFQCKLCKKGYKNRRCLNIHNKRCHSTYGTKK